MVVAGRLRPATATEGTQGRDAHRLVHDVVAGRLRPQPLKACEGVALTGWCTSLLSVGCALLQPLRAYKGITLTDWHMRGKKRKREKRKKRRRKGKKRRGKRKKKKEKGRKREEDIRWMAAVVASKARTLVAWPINLPGAPPSS